MKKRSLAVNLAIIAALGSMAACSKGSGTTETTGTTMAESAAETTTAGKETGENNANSAGNVEIEFLSQKREDVDLFDEIIADFMKKNSGIHMTQTTTTGSVSFASRVAADDVPELGHVYASTAYRTMAEDGFTRSGIFKQNPSGIFRSVYIGRWKCLCGSC